jgi:hypothetical protein
LLSHESVKSLFAWTSDTKCSKNEEHSNLHVNSPSIAYLTHHLVVCFSYKCKHIPNIAFNWSSGFLQGQFIPVTSYVGCSPITSHHVRMSESRLGPSQRHPEEGRVPPGVHPVILQQEKYHPRGQRQVYCFVRQRGTKGPIPDP